MMKKTVLKNENSITTAIPFGMLPFMHIWTDKITAKPTANPKSKLRPCISARSSVVFKQPFKRFTKNPGIGEIKNEP